MLASMTHYKRGRTMRNKCCSTNKCKREMAGSETSLTRSSNRIDYDSLQADKTRDSKDLWSAETNEMRNAVDVKDRRTTEK